MREKHSEVLGVEISSRTLDETIELFLDWIDSPSTQAARYFVCANPTSMEVRLRDQDFRRAIDASDIVTADGVGIYLGALILGRPIPERVCGPDIFARLCDRLNSLRPGTRVFFFGTTKENLCELSRRFELEFPRLKIAGTLAPPFAEEFADDENAYMVDVINASGAELLWVGLGSPKQEKWVLRNKNNLCVRMIGPIGAVFDFYTGMVKLPPRWAQRIGLIWLFRLFQEPRRLWFRNYLKIFFVWNVIKSRVAIWVR